MIRLDAIHGTIEVLVDADEFAARLPANVDLSHNDYGMGRELFSIFRQMAGPADLGGGVLN
jgi:phosphogluconate dehydratase